MKHISPWNALQDYKYVVCDKESPITYCELFKRKDIAIKVWGYLNENYNDAYEVREIISLEEFVDRLNYFIAERIKNWNIDRDCDDIIRCLKLTTMSHLEYVRKYEYNRGWNDALKDKNLKHLAVEHEKVKIIEEVKQWNIKELEDLKNRILYILNNS